MICVRGFAFPKSPLVSYAEYDIFKTYLANEWSKLLNQQI